MLNARAVLYFVVATAEFSPKTRKRYNMKMRKYFRHFPFDRNWPNANSKQLKFGNFHLPALRCEHLFRRSAVRVRASTVTMLDVFAVPVAQVDRAIV